VTRQLEAKSITCKVTRSASSTTVWQVGFTLIVFLGIANRFYAVDRPFDANTLNPWREADYTLVARAFYRESLNILEPRIAWRGETSGLVEMEFPFLPWSAAVLYYVVGEREIVLRILSSLAGAGGVVMFGLLARRLLPLPAALAAVVLFVLNPLLLSFAGAMQPEPLTLLLTVSTIWLIDRWRETRHGGLLVASGAVAGLAILSKSPAAYVGLVLAWVVLRTSGIAAFRRPAVWLAALLGLVPPLLWYWHAHGHYEQTGLSLGVSNEAHFLNATLLRHPKSWILGNVQAELHYVFAGCGILLALAAIGHAKYRRRSEIPLVWYAAIGLFYVAAANTSGDPWAYYYHCHSVPPACLLMGAGATAIADGRRWRTLPAVVLYSLTVAATGWIGGQLVYKRFHQPQLQRLAHCTERLANAVPSDARVIVRGGISTDWTGRPVAYNESMVFVWLDRYGTNYPRDQLSLENIRALVGEGTWYWLAQPADFENPAFAAAARAAFRVVAECDEYVLFDVSQKDRRAHG
jgi:hypothetical protein